LICPVVGNEMSPERKPEIRLEIDHVLFIDIVAYSKLLITEQSEQIQKPKQIVRGTGQFCMAEAEGKLLRLPTGYGGPLVFRTCRIFRWRHALRHSLSKISRSRFRAATARGQRAKRPSGILPRKRPWARPPPQRGSAAADQFCVESPQFPIRLEVVLDAQPVSR